MIHLCATMTLSPVLHGSSDFQLSSLIGRLLQSLSSTSNDRLSGSRIPPGRRTEPSPRPSITRRTFLSLDSCVLVLDSVEDSVDNFPPVRSIKTHFSRCELIERGRATLPHLHHLLSYYCSPRQVHHLCAAT